MAEVSVQQAILDTLTGLREEVTHLKGDVHYLIEAVEDVRLTTEEKKLLDDCIARVKADVKRIIQKVEELAENPFPKDVKRVEGYSDVKVFRVRVGDYRILYFVRYENSTLFVVKIDKRERVY